MHLVEATINACWVSEQMRGWMRKHSEPLALGLSRYSERVAGINVCVCVLSQIEGSKIHPL